MAAVAANAAAPRLTAKLLRRRIHNRTMVVSTQAAPAANRAKKSVAADPMVFVDIGGKVFRTPAQPREFNPLWEYPFVILFRNAGDRQGAEPDTVVRVHVVDFDGAAAYDIIGSTLLSVEELASTPVHRLAPFGSVKRLTSQVESRKAPGPDTEPSTGSSSNDTLTHGEYSPLVSSRV